MHSSKFRLLVRFAILYSLSKGALAQVNLGTAAPFGILASTAITNTGTTVVAGRLAISPNDESSISGFPLGISSGVNANDARAIQARADARTAYNAAAAMSTTAEILGNELGGQTLVAGTYTSTSSVGITGTVTLDGKNNPDALFVFQIGSTLTTATSSSVVLINGAQACNVFWQVGSSATLGTTTTFTGSILALTSISLNEGVTVAGGLYALNGAVTLINDKVTVQPACVAQVSSEISSVPTVSSTISSSSVSSPGGDTPTSGDDIPTAGPGDDTSTTLPVPVDSTRSRRTNVPTTLPEDKSSTPLTSTVSTSRITPTSSGLPSSTSLALSTSSYGSATSSASSTRQSSANSTSYSTGTGPSLSTPVPSSTHEMITTINGTPCTTLSYYETTCSCTKTTVVPLAITQAPSHERAAMGITVVDGIPCTTTKYYESTCDCILTSNVPIQVASATASIVTVINGVPCIASRYYESACDCIKTATVPVQLASVGESTPVTAASTATTTAAACTQTAQFLFSCVSACMDLYSIAIAEKPTVAQSCSKIV